MSKKEKKKEDYDKNIIQKNISEECTDAVNIFAANKNRMRHIPQFSDGLLPGERRALYAMMYEKGLRYDKPYKKMPSSVGAAMEYHPHGDVNIVNTINKLSQYWKNTQTLIDVHGNNGSEKGDDPAAQRYLEAKLTKYTHKCYFEDFHPDIVDMKEAYNGQAMEPEYLPAKYPHVLFKPTYAIGVGLMSSIPTYNFKEICEFVIKLMDDPEYDEIIYPDIPTGCDIIDDGQFDDIRRTGKGKFRMKPRVRIDEEKSLIRIEAMPLFTNINLLIETDDPKKDSRLISLVKSGDLVGYEDIYDRSTEHTAAIEIKFKKGTDLYRALDVLYRKGMIIKSLPIKFSVIDDEYEVKDHTLKSLLLVWLDFRRDTKRREINKGIVRKRERLHILNTLIYILTGKNGEKTLEIVRKANNKKEIREGLMKAFHITSLQAESIANMSISAFSKESFKAYKKEYAKLDEEVEKLLKISKSAKKIDNVIRKELKEGIELFGSDRKSNIVKFNNERIIKNTEHVMVFTHFNRVKKLSSSIEKLGDFESGDKPIEALSVDNSSSLLLFDQMGKVNKLNVYDVVDTDVSNKGIPLSDIINIHGKLVKVIPFPTEKELEKVKLDSIYIIMVTKNGIIKKTAFTNFMSIKRDLTAAVLGKDDEIVDVKLIHGNKQIIIHTLHGKGVRISTSDIKETGRISIGVKALDLNKDDYVLGMNTISRKDKYIFVLTNKGRCKKCTLDTFALMKRNTQPLVISSLGKNECIEKITPTSGKDKFTVFTINNIYEINIEDVAEMTRLAQPKKVIPLPTGDKIVEVR